ncbi:hypothetical protein MNBD_GAMMA15-202 [hydrothermal vent metagenome]|uniref:Uncharacterized protein n=1 Tax=hydrothermal vent metagenome TaxID=652676 RepID=A0A3B0YV00_9ZZZZ
MRDLQAFMQYAGFIKLMKIPLPTMYHVKTILNREI